MSHVDIGFSENCESWQLESPQFPCKIGGKPAWLSFRNLPTLENLHCSTCRQQMIFLCQVYAPYEDSSENFHRTLFVFICKTPTCSIRNSSENVRVFRSNIPRRNDFYSYEPPADNRVNFSTAQWARLCELCGCPGEKNCSKCKQTIYCCREHQVIHWKEIHKNACGKSTADQSESKYLYPESEIAIEAEEIEERHVDEEAEIENFKRLQLDGKAGTLTEASEEELEEHAAIDSDKVFTQFRKRISANPEQILRYDRGGKPLWIASKPVPAAVPVCENCGGPRQFEFQIMPQLLSVLKEYDLDFGVLAVYSCVNSCVNDGYKMEFIFRQDVQETGL